MPIENKTYIDQNFESLVKRPENLSDKDRAKSVIPHFNPLIKYIVFYEFGSVEESLEKIKKLQALAQESRDDGKWSDVMYISRDITNRIKAGYEALEPDKWIRNEYKGFKIPGRSDLEHFKNIIYKELGDKEFKPIDLEPILKKELGGLYVHSRCSNILYSLFIRGMVERKGTPPRYYIYRFIPESELKQPRNS